LGINTPLYFQIEMDLREKIVDGGFIPGHQLPSERELVQEYKVSRLTVREAINRLVAQGMVIKKQGKGTFIAEKSADHMVGPLNSSSEVFLLNNYRVKTTVLKAERIFPSNKILENLHLPDTGAEEVYYLERVRYANETPVAYINCYIPYKFVKNIETFDFSKATLYRTLEDYYRLELSEAYEVIEATCVDRSNAKLLGLSVGDPVLMNHRTTYLTDGNVIEYEKVLYRSDIYKYHNKLIRKGQSNLP
jgi:GntR family transcriptional regulator